MLKIHIHESGGKGMCGRFFVDAKNREIDRLIESLQSDSPPARLGEVFPTNNALVLAQGSIKSEPRVMQWGFPRHDNKGVIINARAESALAKPMFADALRNNPIAIPASGFYEWKSAPDKKQKDKFLFRGPAPLLWMAGFWNTFNTPTGDHTPCFTILTTAANESVLPWHGRMPLLLEENQLDGWLNGTHIQPILCQKPINVQAEPVSATL